MRGGFENTSYNEGEKRWLRLHLDRPPDPKEVADVLWNGSLAVQADGVVLGVFPGFLEDREGRNGREAGCFLGSPSPPNDSQQLATYCPTRVWLTNSRKNERILPRSTPIIDSCQRQKKKKKLGRTRFSGTAVSNALLVGEAIMYINKMNMSACWWVRTAATRILVGKQDCGRGDGGRASGWTTARIPTVHSERSDSVRV